MELFSLQQKQKETESVWDSSGKSWLPLLVFKAVCGKDGESLSFSLFLCCFHQYYYAFFSSSECFYSLCA